MVLEGIYRQRRHQKADGQTGGDAAYDIAKAVVQSHITDNGGQRGGHQSHGGILAEGLLVIEGVQKGPGQNGPDVKDILSEKTKVIPNIANMLCFVDYFICVENWYKEFCKKHEKWIYELEQQDLLGTLDEESRHKYEIIQAFVSAKSNFSHKIQATMRLETMLIRKNAFALVQAFEKVKKIII